MKYLSLYSASIRNSQFENIPFQARVVVKLRNVHSKERREKRQRQKYERQPTNPPQTRVELQGLASIADTDRFVHLATQSAPFTR